MPEEPPNSSSFTAAHYFPSRRRVWQACTNCRARKTRCDAAKPKCSLCMAQGVDCVYQDSQQPRIEHNTRILLERIQLLEDRIFSSSAFSASASSGNGGELSSAPTHNKRQRASSQGDGQHAPEQSASREAPEGESQIPIPLSHTANANHVIDWPVVRQLLARSHVHLPQQPRAGDIESTGATDVFFLEEGNAYSQNPPMSWRLFDSSPDDATVEEYRGLIFTYFEHVNVFYPLLSLDSIMHDLDLIVSSNSSSKQVGSSVPAALYCLVELVLCLGRFVQSGIGRVHLRSEDETDDHDHYDRNWNDQLWEKSKLLLGSISADASLEAAQCSMLASIYMGARGRVSQSFHWAHAAAVKCEAIAKRTLLTSAGPDSFSESFRRLYWVAFMYEGDFVSEISITLPSGISRYEDIVPYPANATFSRHLNNVDSPSTPESTRALAAYDKTEELVAFQISTNGAIRRFLNRVNSVVYDSKDQFRMTRSSYANWLLRITEDLWSYHDAIYKNLPDFLLKSQPQHNRANGPDTASHASPSGTENFRNNPWNVRRLEGRFYAGQYIIHRPFLEYILLNIDHFNTHPCREAILERGRLCLQGCSGFIKVFDTDPANSVTCLFASGMVTFTMVIILRVATTCAVFNNILLADTEDVIAIGKRNLRRFSVSIPEFRWHLDVLEALDKACQDEANSHLPSGGGYNHDRRL